MARGDYSLDEVLTTKQLEISTLAHATTQAALRDKVPTGVQITEVAIKSADVPEKARKAFDDLTRTLAKVQGELAEAKACYREAASIYSLLGDNRLARLLRGELAVDVDVARQCEHLLGRLVGDAIFAHRYRTR